MASPATPDERQRSSGVRLDQGTIVRAALELVAREGAEAVTMRRLGRELGADPTAVYRHFRSKEALFDAMADALFAQSLEGWQASGDWRENLRALMGAGFRLYHENASMAVHLAQRPDETQALIDLTEHLVDQLRRAGLSADDAALAYHSIVDVVVGTGLFFAAAPTNEEDRASARRTYATLPPDAFPNAVAVAPHLFPDESAVFDHTVELLLDAIELRASRATTQEEPT